VNAIESNMEVLHELWATLLADYAPRLTDEDEQVVLSLEEQVLGGTAGKAEIAETKKTLLANRLRSYVPVHLEDGTILILKAEERKRMFRLYIDQNPHLSFSRILRAPLHRVFRDW